MLWATIAALALAPSSFPIYLRASSRCNSFTLCASPTLGEELVPFAWAQAPKPLLRIGKGGTTQAHARSLTQLLSEHHIVCVKLNGGKPFQEMATGLCELAARLEGATPQTTPVLLCSKAIRRGGSSGLFVQRQQLERVTSMEYYAELEKAQEALTEEDARYAQIRADRDSRLRQRDDVAFKEFP